MIISFIIPVYNTGCYLERCVGSILNQGIDENLFEIIIINDGSTDDSAQIMANLAKDRHCVKCIYTGNRGLGAARNLGLNVSQGKYIFFVDSDDYLFDNSFIRVFRYAESETSDIIGFDWAQVYPDGAIVKKERKSSIYNSYMSGARCLNKFNLSGGVWSYLFSASFLKDTSILMPEDIYHEDELFLSEVFTCARQIVFVNQQVYAYCQREDSITNNKNKSLINKRINDHLYILDRLFYLLNQEDLSKLQRSGLKRRIHFQTVDFIVNLTRFEVDKITIGRMLKELRNRKLFPLAKKSYSCKYILFSIVFSCKASIILASKSGLFKK